MKVKTLKVIQNNYVAMVNSFSMWYLPFWSIILLEIGVALSLIYLSEQLSSRQIRRKKTSWLCSNFVWSLFEKYVQSFLPVKPIFALTLFAKSFFKFLVNDFGHWLFSFIYGTTEPDFLRNLVSLFLDIALLLWLELEVFFVNLSVFFVSLFFV